VIWTSGIDSAILKQSIPFAVHTVMFLPSLVSQSTQEQKEEWVERAFKYSILGTYAQVILTCYNYLNNKKYDISFYFPFSSCHYSKSV